MNTPGFDPHRWSLSIRMIIPTHRAGSDARQARGSEAARNAEAAAANLLGAEDEDEEAMEKQLQEESVMADVQAVLAAALDGAAKLVRERGASVGWKLRALWGERGELAG